MSNITDSEVSLLRDRVAGEEGVTLVAVGSAPQQCSLALRAGADGFILTCEPAESARGRLQAAVRGEMVLCAEAVAALQTQFETYRIRTNAIAETLSRREGEALALLCRGAPLRTIAQQMGVTYNTAVTYIRRASEKVGASSRIELTRFGFQIGIERLRPSASDSDDDTPHAG
ncbi:LuxR C-terminal-related transcriptional regulator [Flagellatimonas centrodinii]|uniref:response regulator transcription factor n=1 Tax=Flagellatimonas centrodinii TaxID=2806210 RepID=UPI001FEF51E9|nr:LuxR C-terminal-related transcriptional regulator [Flagellatimonas centrodinii]ULQ47130.1 LuxR C-terminal-related transcriptional regulator [Flagellatimonas centrodinii]